MLVTIKWTCSVQFSRSVTSDSLQPHGLQCARLPCRHQVPELAQTHVHRVSEPGVLINFYWQQFVWKIFQASENVYTLWKIILLLRIYAIAKKNFLYKQIYCIIIYERIQQQKKCLAVGKWLNKPCYIKIRDTRLYIFEITKLMHGKIIIVVGLNDGTISGFFFLFNRF